MLLSMKFTIIISHTKVRVLHNADYKRIDYSFDLILYYSYSYYKNSKSN